MVTLILLGIVFSAIAVGILLGCGALFLRINDYFWLRKEVKNLSTVQVTKPIFPMLEQIFNNNEKAENEIKSYLQKIIVRKTLSLS